MSAAAKNSLARRRRSRRFFTAGALAALAFGGQLPRAQAAGILSQGNSAMAAIPSSIAANLAAEQQGQAVAAQAENQLARVNAALQGMQNMQTAARNLAFAAPSAVPEGLQPGGLVPIKPATWTGAQAPVQSGSAAAPTVTVKQTASQAILSWSSFNVGRGTTVDFNQQGNTNWVALNQITSPTSSPSQILGSIKASGQVYLINQNGIIFGGTAQVDVGALIASSAEISDSQFLTDGIYSVDADASFTNSGAAIVVQPGAIIDTSAPASVSTGGGFVLLLGTQVRNAGAISTPDGQTELAAGDNFLIRQGYSTTSNDSSTTRGNEIAVKLNNLGSSLKGGSGLVENTGEITSDTGDITLVGETVQQNGVALSTTSVAVRGTIHLLSSATDPFSSITLGSNATTLIKPDLSSTATELDSQREGLIADAATANNQRTQAASGQFNDLSLLGDLEDESRIEIVSGNTVEFQNGSDSSAPGGQIAVSAVNRVQVDDGAVLDVSGSYGVSLPMSDNDIQVNVQNYELRDNPQNRLTGGLSNSTVNVDAQDVTVVPATAADANVRDYTAGGLFEVSGYLANVEHTIGEYTALGGQITLSTGNKGAIVAQAGSTLDINGGSLQYQSGYLAQSYLVGTNGQLYNANNAPAYLTYAGVYTGFTVDHARWNATQSYVDSLKAPTEIYQQGYTEGRAAGTLTLSSPTTIFDGTLDAGTTNGPLQTAADPAGVSDPYLYTQSEVAEPGTLDIAGLAVANLVLDNTDVTFAISAPQARDINVKIPKALAGTTTLSSTTINNAGLGGLEVLTNGSISVDAPLSFAPGAQIGLYGSSVDIAANITAAGGSVTASQLAPGGLLATAPAVKGKATAASNIVLAKDATIDTAGLWTNLLLNPNVTFTQAFIDGGAVDLASVNSLTLQSGSLIDSSAGGDVGLTGTVKGGAGGAITLEAAIPNPGTATPVGNLKLRGRLISIGATSGGALTLHAPSFLITSQVVAAASAGLVTLDPAFFRQGFSAYNLQSTGKITVAPGTVVTVTEPTYQTTAATLSTPTGAAPAQAFTVALDPLYVPNSTSSAITQRPGASFSAEIVSPSNTFSSDPKFISATTLSIGTGAAINVDPGQSISLQSVSQLTIDGSLSAPGGSISAASLFNTQAALPGPGTASIWLGPSASLNVSGRAVSFQNSAGNRISLAPAGGTITLGSDTSTASVIIRQGAVVSASGSAATDVIAATALSATAGIAQALNQAIPIEGAGGSIAIASQEGIYNDGALIAAAGGPSAAGGSLAMTLEPDLVVNASGTAEATPRIFNITQNGSGPLLAADLQPGSSTGLTIGTATISEQQIAAGGFGSVTLFTQDAFRFHGNVTLHVPQSISLEEGYITDSSRHGSVTVDAPYVLLSGNSLDTTETSVPFSVITGFSAQHATGVFTVNAATIEINNAVRFGGILPAEGTAAATDLAGFGSVNLNSSGDLQFVAPDDYGGTHPTASYNTLVTRANLTLTAREIYAIGSSGSQAGVPVTSALIVAGYNPVAGSADGNFSRDGTLTIRRTPGTTAIAPDTLAGQLTFVAPTIDQAGVIWQPLGSITLGDITTGTINNFALTGDPNGAVNFLNGSVTSVSAAGLNIPFGGTTDGVNYDVDGALISTSSSSFGLDSVSGGVAPGIITIAALQTDIQSGATLDLQGGGTLSGAGFISGEGGSTDVLTNPLLSSGASGVVQPSLNSDPVYAIVAGAQPVSAVAYTQSGTVGSVPRLGQQIVIPAGVPGLAAGTYTLLPAQYALEPGGYRVEFDGAAALTAASVGALPNGSYAVAGYTALAGTNIRGTLASNFTVTPGATVLNYADYDQEDYAAFLVANTARLGELRPVLPIDAGTLALNVPTSALVSVTDAGAVSFAAADGGIGGTLQIGSGNRGDTGLPDLDFYNTAPAAGLPKKTVSLSAAQIDAFHPFILEIGVAGGGSNAGVQSITLEDGAILTAARVVLTAQAGGITLESGSGIDTINQGTLAVDSTTEGLLNNHGATVLDVGNGYLVYGTTTTLGAKYGPITVQDGAEIYTDGSIDFSTGGAVNLGVGASYGGKYIDLAVPVISVSGKGAGGNAPTGVLLTAAVVQALTRGVPDQDVPAVQILDLTAFDSLNLYGDASLDLTNADVQLVIDTPAIYGFGSGTATIGAGTIVWNGISTLAADGVTIVSTPPGTGDPIGRGNGNGTLNLDAADIVLGYSSLDIPQRDVSLSRLADGFSTVNLNATNEITANNQGTLAVYASVPTYGSPGTGGTLNLNSPLLTAADGATIGLLAGGNINVNSAPGVAPATSLAGEAAGGEIDLTGADIAIDSAIILPSGKLNLQATGNITLAGRSLLNLAGAVTTNNTETVYGFGGELVMESATGDITQDSGSVIDVGATGNTAGSVAVTATAAGTNVALLGTLSGASTGGYDSGSFTIRAQDLGDFTALNNSLDAGGFFQSRSFDIAQGDLTIGDGVQAHNVSVSLDDGSLTVTGTINASGNGGGVIDLSASGDLILANGAVLDAHGTTTPEDSYGEAIASENSPSISLTSGGGSAGSPTGTLILGTDTSAPAPVIDLASEDGIAGGDLELNAPRTGPSAASATDSQTIIDPIDGNVTTGADGPANAQGNDIAISAAGPLNIIGAATIALNGTATYKNAPADPNDSNGQIIDQAYLDLINTDSQAFMNRATANPALAGQIAGLTAYASVFHLRPGVQIVSATPDGDIGVDGDINLAGYRYSDVGYGLQVNSNYGSGEPGTLAIRAGGNLNVYGSITDGFEQPIDDTGTEFNNGMNWVIFGGGEPYGQNQVLPIAVPIAAGSFLPADATVNFAADIAGGSFPANAITPVQLTVTADHTVHTSFIATSEITSASGAPLFMKGALVPVGSVIPEGAKIAAGGSLPFAVGVGPATWLPNVPITVVNNLSDGSTGVLLQSGSVLPAGALLPAGSALNFAPGTPGLIIPTNSSGQRLTFPDGTKLPEMLDTRIAGADGQGQLYGLAALLPAPDKSWSINLVSGSDTTAAGTLVVQAASTLGTGGNLTLADTHYGVDITNKHGTNATETVVPAFSVVRTGTGSLNLVAGGSLDEESSFGIYTAGAQSPAILNADGKNPYDLAQGVTKDGTVLGLKNATLAALVANYQADYPTGGGNVLVAAQGNLNGFISTASSPESYELNAVSLTDSDALGGWLWRQGGAGELGAWWINFGGLDLTASSGGQVQMTGFQGIGTLGGGNLTVSAGGNANQLNLAVASNGRVTSSATPTIDGGGSLNVTIGGAVNFTEATNEPGQLPNAEDAGGLITDLRGNVLINAGSIGSVQPIYGTVNGNDPRFLSPFASEEAGFGNGFDLAPGDATITVEARGDLAVGSAVNPGTVQNTVNTTLVDGADDGATDFSLWTASTSIALFSAGGDVVPAEKPPSSSTPENDTQQLLYTPTLLATAQNGDIYFGQSQELAPAPDGQLELLAAGSIIGINDPTVSISGADLSVVATPFDPDIRVSTTSGKLLFTTRSSLSNAEPLDFGSDTASGPLHANDTQPAQIYAANGDILDIEFGDYVAAATSSNHTEQVIAAKPFDIFAGRDIVDSGTLLTPDIFLNLNASDITSITAGRDILESSFDIAGPGNLLVQAGRNLYQADQGAIDSLGLVFGITPANRDTGASISVLAGVGSGPDYTDFANEFLDPPSTLELDDASSILQTDDASLFAWLQTNTSYSGDQAGAYAYFQTLPAGRQDVFLRQLYFAILNTSGLEFNDPTSAHYKSYVLGKDAIASLFPNNIPNGDTAPDTGDITLFGPSGIQTLFGGSIETMTPGGQTIVGVEGTTPPSTAGFITQGSGDIDIYAQDSVLLGESRVITTFGGNILVWSALGNINAGRGSKTTIDYTPVQRLYDDYGNIFLSPTVPSSGAGIATLAPIPGIPPGDINLIAPVGTVDAGEAGIRGSGNLNIAALHVLNAANIQVQGGTTGVPTASAPNVGALTSASSAAGAATAAAENSTPKQQAAPQPSIWIVEILGYGGSGSEPSPPQDQRKAKRSQTLAGLSQGQTNQASLF